MTTPTSNVEAAAQLGTKERLTFKFDMTNDLLDEEGDPVATITQVAWLVYPEDKGLTLTNPWISTDGKVAGIYASTPTRATYYRVTCLITLSTTEIHEKTWGIGGIQKSEEGATPIITLVS